MLCTVGCIYTKCSGLYHLPRTPLLSLLSPHILSYVGSVRGGNWTTAGPTTNNIDTFQYTAVHAYAAVHVYLAVHIYAAVHGMPCRNPWYAVVYEIDLAAELMRSLDHCSDPAIVHMRGNPTYSITYNISAKLSMSGT